MRPRPACMTEPHYGNDPPRAERGGHILLQITAAFWPAESKTAIPFGDRGFFCLSGNIVKFYYIFSAAWLQPVRTGADKFPAGKTAYMAAGVHRLTGICACHELIWADAHSGAAVEVLYRVV